MRNELKQNQDHDSLLLRPIFFSSTTKKKDPKCKVPNKEFTVDRQMRSLLLQKVSLMLN